MQTLELTAKSVDEAKRMAAERLGVSADSVQVTVLEETKGLFGKANVRVRAEAQTAAVETAPAKPPKAEKAEKAEKEAAAKPKPERKRTTKATAAAVVEQAETAGVTVTEPEVVEEMQAMDAPAADAPAEHVEEEAPIVATAEDAERLLGLVMEILKSGDLEVTANATANGGRYVNIELDGKDVAYLVGKHGEVLNALQYIVNIASARRYGSGVRATLDGNNYRTRREAALTALATKIAEEVRSRREEAVLDALPAFERRVVHKALSVIEGVETYSEGEEPNRRVVIAPAE